MNRISYLSIILILSAVQGLAQSDTASGNPAFSTQIAGAIDHIDLASSNILLDLPIRSKLGKLPFSYSLIGDSHEYSYVQQSPGNPRYWYWGTTLNGQPKSTLLGAELLSSTKTITCGSDKFDTETYAWVLVDSQGTHHPFNNQPIDSDGCVGTTSSGITTDNTGYSLSVPGYALYDRSGNHVSAWYGLWIIGVADPDNVSISYSEVPDNLGDDFTYTDSLDKVALQTKQFYANNGTSDSYTYLGGDGQNHTITVTYSHLYIKTVFGCAGINDSTGTTNAYFPTSISTAVGTYGISYEQTPNNSGYYTGRVAKITLPSGGYIAYLYSGGNSGINCNSGVVPTLTRQEYDNSSNTLTSWTYVNGNNSSTPGNFTVVATDPAGNQTLYNFAGEYQTQAASYQGGCPTGSASGCNGGGTLLRTTTTCYNATFGNCAAPSNVPLLPISQTDVYKSLNTSPASLVETKYDSYGNVTYVAAYDYNQSPGVVPSGTPLKTVTTTYASPGNDIYDKPASVVVAANGTTASQTSYSSYTSTGHAQSVSTWSGWAASGWLTKNYSYNSNGTLAAVQDVNYADHQTLYSYNYNGSGECNSLLPTSLTVTGQGLPSSGLTTSTQWNCDGAVATKTFDANQQPTTYTYNDPLWRGTSVEDPTGATTTTCYGLLSNGTCALNPNYLETVLPVSTGSAYDNVTTLDGLGRVIFSQQRQAPGSGSFDSVQHTYGWDGTGEFTTLSLPYSGTQDQAAPSGTSTTTQYDAIGRVTTVSDAKNGTVSYSYSQNDILQTLSPAPNGEHNKQKQLQYDGLARLTSVCEITSVLPGYGNCPQTNATHGYYTTYSYPINQIKVTQNAQSSTPQTRTFSYDEMGRLYQQQTPEGGTVTYYYDSANGWGCPTSVGDIVESADNAGNTVCYGYDALHRKTSVTYVGGPNASLTSSKTFVYDSATVNGLNMGNALGRLAEAYTGASGSKTTDLGYTYSVRGDITDAWENTPSSGGYYHTTAAYWPNRLLETLWISTLPTITYTPDGEGRTSTVTASSGQNPVPTTSPTQYNAASQVTHVSFGSGDGDQFFYDSQTGRMTQYKLWVNGSNTYGNLGWNQNGTLGSLAITDPYNSGDNQSCSYSYDDLSRIASANCGSPWTQTFTYDAYGNITKNGSISWACANCYNNNNQYNSSLSPQISYDANGNLLNDNFHSYTWNVDGRPVAIDSITRTYDAFGRLVEQNISGTNYQTVYTPMGTKLGVFNGSTMQQVYVPLPGGANAEYYSWGLAAYRHADWLGSDRLESSYQGNVAPTDNNAYAPFGEPYAQSGDGEISFTGQNKDTDWLQYDFPVRQYDPKQGRWISPDPASMGAANPENPQSWNRYAYVSNSPLTSIDPSGMMVYPIEELYLSINQMDNFFGDAGPLNQVQSFLNDGGCSIDMVAEPCGLAHGLLGSGAAAQCPDNDCMNITVQSNGEVYRNTYTPGDLVMLCQGQTSSYGCSWSNWSKQFVYNADQVYTFNAPVDWSQALQQQILQTAAATMNDWRTIGGWYALSAAAGATVLAPSEEGLVSLANTDPMPPGWTEEWELGPGSRAGQDTSWWDPNGGEWNWQWEDTWHPDAHWNYNPWTHPSSPWQNLYPPYSF